MSGTTPLFARRITGTGFLRLSPSGTLPKKLVVLLLFRLIPHFFAVYPPVLFTFWICHSFLTEKMHALLWIHSGNCGPVGAVGERAAGEPPTATNTNILGPRGDSEANKGGDRLLFDTSLRRSWWITDVLDHS